MRSTDLFVLDALVGFGLVSDDVLVVDLEETFSLLLPEWFSDQVVFSFVRLRFFFQGASLRFCLHCRQDCASICVPLIAVDNSLKKDHTTARCSDVAICPSSFTFLHRRSCTPSLGFDLTHHITELGITIIQLIVNLF